MPYLIAALLALFSTVAQAQGLPAPWQERRDIVVDLAERACAGNSSAEAEVRRRLDAGDVVMLNSGAWLKANCASFSGFTEEDVADMQRRSAQGGYPIGISNYGTRRIFGLGTYKNPEHGIALKDVAIAEGYAQAAFELARYYARGEGLPQQLGRARPYLDQARAGHVDPQRIASLAKEIAQASNPAGNAPWVAIAYDRNKTGSGGIAVDAPSERVARLTAIAMCERSGGETCEVSGIVSAGGCAGYMTKRRGDRMVSLTSGANTRAQVMVELLESCDKTTMPGQRSEALVICSAEVYQ